MRKRHGHADDERLVRHVSHTAVRIKADHIHVTGPNRIEIDHSVADFADLLQGRTIPVNRRASRRQRPSRELATGTSENIAVQCHRLTVDIVLISHIPATIDGIEPDLIRLRHPVRKQFAINLRHFG